MPALRGLVTWVAGVAPIVMLSLGGMPAGANETSDTGGHEYHRHHVGAFLGAATRAAEGGGHDHGFVGGLDYEYRFSRWVGAGVLVEGATGDLRDGVFTGLLFVHREPVYVYGLVLGVGF